MWQHKPSSGPMLVASDTVRTGAHCQTASGVLVRVEPAVLDLAGRALYLHYGAFCFGAEPSLGGAGVTLQPNAWGLP